MLLPALAHAAQPLRLAVVELRNGAGLSQDEAQYLTDQVRSQASVALPGERFLVMTRESIRALLPPGKTLADCAKGQCEVEVGRMIGADYIVTGEILKFGDELRMNLKAHHCGSGAFLGSEAAGGAKLADLEKGVTAASGHLFARVRAHAGPVREVEGRVGETGPGAWSIPGDSAAVVGFVSDPPGAVVMVDGRVVCQGTPCSRELPLGATMVTMQKERYLPKQELVEVARRNPTLRLTWALDPDFGWLTVRSVPPGLPVIINGEPAGPTPVEGSERSPGTYEVRVRDSRYYERGERVVLGRGEKKTVTLSPEPREGAIRVSARDADSNAVAARVLLDGVEVGTTPCTIKALVGRHAIMAQLDGAQWADSVQVVERQVASVQARIRSVPRANTNSVIGAVNLLQNPGFEQPLVDDEWMPAGWDTSVSGLPTVFFGRDALLAYKGSYSVSLANLSVLFPMGHNWSQTLLVDSTPVGRKMWGKDLVFSVWTRSIGIEGRAYILVQAYRDTISKMALIWGVDREAAQNRLNIKPVDDPLLDLGWKRQFFSENETEWVRRELRVYCPPTVNVIFVRLGIQGTGQMMFDEASLTVEDPLPAKTPAPGENLLADPGFEGDGTAWEYSMPAYRGMRIEMNSTVAHSGRQSVRCQSGEGEYVSARSGPCQVICNRALQGKRVRLTAWCRTESLRGTAYTKIYCHTLSGMRQVPQVQQFGGTMDWKKTKLEMDVPKDTYAIWAWCAWDAPVTGLVYWDDATLEVVGSSP